jgi:cob(I)alamin adenosyltransferase
VVQFLKGAIDTAEERVLKSFGDQVVFLRMGEGYTWETQDRERDKAVAQEAWAEVEKFLQDSGFGMVVLDELND